MLRMTVDISYYRRQNYTRHRRYFFQSWNFISVYWTIYISRHGRPLLSKAHICQSHVFN